MNKMPRWMKIAGIVGLGGLTLWAAPLLFTSVGLAGVGAAFSSVGVAAPALSLGVVPAVGKVLVDGAKAVGNFVKNIFTRNKAPKQEKKIEKNKDMEKVLEKLNALEKNIENLQTQLQTKLLELQDAIKNVNKNTEALRKEFLRENKKLMEAIKKSNEELSKQIAANTEKLAALEEQFKTANEETKKDLTAQIESLKQYIDGLKNKKEENDVIVNVYNNINLTIEMSSSPYKEIQEIDIEKIAEEVEKKIKGKDETGEKKTEPTPEESNKIILEIKGIEERVNSVFINTKNNQVNYFLSLVEEEIELTKGTKLEKVYKALYERVFDEARKRGKTIVETNGKKTLKTKAGTEIKVKTDKRAEGMNEIFEETKGAINKAKKTPRKP